MAGMEFYEKNFEIHGEFCGKVYHKKRNGDQEIYDYEPVSYYERTPLVIRNEQIRKFAASVSNPHDPDYKHILRKMLYYTPYIINPGVHEFLSGTVFYVREKGSFEFLWEGSDMGSFYKLGKRSKVRFGFHSSGTKQLNVYSKEGLYCQREFVIIDNSDLDAEYEAWLAANLDEILELPEPDFESLKLYRRGMVSRSSWVKTVTGKEGDEVLATRKDLAYKDIKRRPWIYHRRSYDHSVNPQSQAFNSKMPEIAEAWKALSDEERKYWNDLANAFKYKQSGFNRFTAYYLLE